MLKGFIPVVAGLVVGGGLSQFPEYSQQYAQRVGGAYSELKIVADGFRMDAANNGKTVAQAIAEYAAADSNFFNDRGVRIAGVMEREAFLKQHVEALKNPSGLATLWTFAQARDAKVAREALSDYKPAVPLTMEGVWHAALGFFLGFGLLRIPFLFRKRRKA